MFAANLKFDKSRQINVFYDYNEQNHLSIETLTISCSVVFLTIIKNGFYILIILNKFNRYNHKTHLCVSICRISNLPRI